MKTLALTLCFASLLYADRLMVDTATLRAMVQDTCITNRVQQVGIPVATGSNDVTVTFGTTVLSFSGTAWRVSGTVTSNATSIVAGQPRMVGPARTDAVLSRTIGQSNLRLTNTMWDAVHALIATLSITNTP